MAKRNCRSKVGAVDVGKSKGRKNKVVEVVDVAAGFRMKLKFFFSCMALRPQVGSSGDNNKQHGSSSSHDNGKEQVAQATSNTSNSATVAQLTPNSSAELSAYPHFHNFSYSDLRLATRNFRREHFLGEGGFGSVFKGWLSNDAMTPTRPGMGMPVAVKTLNKDGLQGHTEWLTELNYLSQLQHPNLVKLVGFCNEGDKRLLVYEFMPRGSLDSHLFRRSVPFPWSIRMRIMLDAAQGLAYLHQDDDNKKAVIFRDFKTSNVLLDRDFNAKLSDFGLAKDGPVGDRSHVSTRVMGTPGYAAPEYVMTGCLTTKSDVYSFGVVLLEMITGKKVIDRLRPLGERNLVPWAVRQIKDGGRLCHMVVVDPRLHGQYSKKSALKALRLAAQCVSHHPSARPEMRDVVQEMKQLPSSTMDDMAHQASPSPSPSSLATTASSHHAIYMQVATSNSNLGVVNKYGLRIGSPSRSVPSRFLASPCDQNYPLPSPKPGPNGGRP